MEIPKHKNFISPQEFESVKEQTLLQLEKDFRLQGINLTVTNRESYYPEILAELAKRMSKLDLINSQAGTGIFYQLDIPEQFITEEVLSREGIQRYQILAEAIIRRCFVKVMYRKKFS
ncbi:MAG: hypothetical protein MK086_07645 [Flavobacteriales bacterium]|nr:hypothetical protein [Flavobacteriales bacterium]